MSEKLTPFLEKGLFASQSDEQLAKMAEVTVEVVAAFRAEHAADTMPKADTPPEDKKPDPEEAIKGADGKANAAPKAEAKASKKPAPKRTPKKPVAKPTAKAAEPAKPAAPKSVQAKVSRTVKGPTGRSLRLRRADVFHGEMAAWLHANHPKLVEAWPRK